jgi:hypothetical protein
VCVTHLATLLETPFKFLVNKFAIPVSELEKPVNDLDCAATVTGVSYTTTGKNEVNDDDNNNNNNNNDNNIVACFANA